jgi:phytoene dehydrogenase-like protein
MRPVGGTQAIPDALAARPKSRGGKATVNSAVAEITTSQGRASGVVLIDGTVIEANRAVVASS